MSRPRNTWWNTHVLGWWWREGTCEQAEEHLAEHSCTRLVVEGRHL